MKKMMSFLDGYAKEKEIPFILETDSKRNEQIYHHYGMETISEQKLDSDLTFYILRSV